MAFEQEKEDFGQGISSLNRADVRQGKALAQGGGCAWAKKGRCRALAAMLSLLLVADPLFSISRAEALEPQANSTGELSELVRTVNELDNELPSAILPEETRDREEDSSSDSDDPDGSSGSAASSEGEGARPASSEETGNVLEPETSSEDDLPTAIGGVDGVDVSAAMDGDPEADAVTSGVFSGEIMPLAASLPSGAVDVNSRWQGQTGGTTLPFEIAQGGTYALTADLTVTSCITVNAPGQDVVIDLGTYRLTAGTSTGTYLIGAVACKSLTIVGSRPFGAPASGDGAFNQLVVTTGTPRHAVESQDGQLTLRNVGIALEANERYTQLTDLGAAGVYVAKGNALLDNCSVFIDHTLQAYRNGNASILKNFPAAVYVAPEVNDVQVSSSQLEVLCSPASARKTDSAYSERGCDNAYGIFCAGETSVSLQGGSIIVDAPQGTATGVLSNKLTVKDGSVPAQVLASATSEEERAVLQAQTELSVVVDGSEFAYGLKTHKEGGIDLDGAVSFSVGETHNPSDASAVATTAENGLALGANFRGSAISVLAGDQDEWTNKHGQHFAQFAPGLSANQKKAMAASFENGLVDGACSVAFDATGLYFQLDLLSAPVVVESSEGNLTPYSSIKEALKEQDAGETVRLMRDGGDVVIDKSVGTKAGRTISLDLNGYSLNTLDVSSSEPVKVFSSSGRGSIAGVSSKDQATVVYSGTGDFSLADVDVSCVSGSRAGMAVKIDGSGTMSMQDATVCAISGAVSARAVQQTSSNSILEARNCTFTASSDAPAVSCYGLTGTADRAQAMLEDCAVIVRSFNGSATGIDYAGKLSIAGKADAPSSITAESAVAAGTVNAVRLSRDVSQAELSNVSLRALCESGDPESGEYWCVASGNSYPSVAAQWTLDGSCSFESAQDTHLAYKKEAITLGSAFVPNVVGSDTGKVALLGVDLTDNVAAECEGTAQAARAASVFESASDSPYRGWNLEVSGNALTWTRESVVRIVGSDKEFPTIREALGSASAGATLELTADCTEIGPLEIDKPVTLDLGGHTLAVDMPARTLGATGAAFSLKGAKSVSFTNGTIEVVLNPSASVLKSDGNYDAIRVASGSSLGLDGVSLKVSLDAQASGSGETNVCAIDASSATVQLKNGSSVEVSITGKHPVVAQGVVYSGTSSATQLAVDESSSVVVRNESERREQGSISRPSNAGTLSKNNLMRIDIQEDDPLYDEIQEKFLAEAKVDFADDPEGFVYGTNVYYAAPIALDDDSYVWAYSNPVEKESIGNLDEIKASAFYFQSRYDAVPVAEAVVVQGEAPRATMNGSIRAEAPLGEAKGVAVSLAQNDDQKGKESVVIGSKASVTAEGGSERYRQRSEGAMDLRTTLGLKATQPVTYPNRFCSYREVVWTNPESVSIGGANAAAVQVNEGATLDGPVKTEKPVTSVDLQSPSVSAPLTRVAETIERPTVPEGLAVSEVDVSFANVRDSSGRIVETPRQIQNYGEKLKIEDGIPQPCDYTHNGVTYRFVGWSVRQTGQGERVWNPDAIGSLVLDGRTDAAEGALTLTATYVPVGPQQVLARFLVDEFVEATSVTKGTVPAYSAATKTAGTTVPSKYRTVTGMIAGFKGWKNPETERVYAGTLPKATEDCTYEATFSFVPQTVKASYYRWEQDGNNVTYRFTPLVVDYGKTAQKEADALVKPGDAIYSEDVVYSFAGWSPRRSDKEPFYGDTLPPVTSERYQFFAVYDERERRIPVTFYVDGEPYAQISSVTGSATVNRAFNATGALKPADKGADLKFRGWSLSPDGDPLIMGAVKTLAELTEGEAPVVLYASYGSPSSIAGEVDAETEGVPGNRVKHPSKGVSPKVGGAPKLSAISATPPQAAANGSGDAGEALNADATPESEEALASTEGSAWDWSEPESTGDALVTFLLTMAVLAGLGGWWFFSLWRNRKLDKEDDYYEPSATSMRGEQVVF